MEKTYITPKKLAEYTNLPVGFIYKLVEQKKISFIRNTEGKKSSIFINQEKALMELEKMEK